MIPIWLGKIVAKRVIKAIKYKIDLKKIDKYVNKPNELDVEVRDLKNSNAILNKYIEINSNKIAKLEKDSHPPQEYICCRKCGCKIAKTKSKKRR
jgi:hypothetical protein